MKFFFNADSNVCSNSTTCSTSNGLAYVQIMRANTPTSLQVQNACYPNNSPNGSILKDLSDVLLSSVEQKVLKINIDYENTHYGDVSFIIKCPSYGSFQHADVTTASGNTPIHVTCYNANGGMVDDINRIITVGIRNQEKFRVISTLEICDASCSITGQERRVIWQGISGTYESLSTVTIPIVLDLYQNAFQSCIPVYTCY